MSKIRNESMRIAGKKIDTEKVIEVIYPFTGNVIGTVPAGNADHAKEALDIAANFTPKLTRYERQKILQNTAAGRGQINVNFPKKVLSGDITPDFPLRMGLKDISLSLLLGSKIGIPLKLGEVSKEYFSLAKSYGRSEQDCTAMLHLIEDISKIKK